MRSCSSKLSLTTHDQIQVETEYMLIIIPQVDLCILNHDMQRWSLKKH